MADRGPITRGDKPKWKPQVEEFLRQHSRAYSYQEIADELAEGDVKKVQSALNALVYKDETIVRRYVGDTAYYCHKEHFAERIDEETDHPSGKFGRIVSKIPFLGG